jgi:hypothetical protein
VTGFLLPKSPTRHSFPPLRLPKHRSVFNAFTHVTAAIIAYQIDPLPPRPIRVVLP